jgi:hypothetical protein
MWTVYCPPESPLSDLTGRVCEKWGLPPDRIVFGIWEMESDLKTVLGSGTRLCDLNLAVNTLVVGFPEQFEIREVAIVPAPVPVTSPSLARSLVLSGDQIVVRFREVSTDRAFTRRLSRLATVDDAKVEVALFLGAPSGDHITLLLNGKPLKGSFILNRLGLRGEISVFVRDDRAVLLATAGAMR